MTFKNLYSKYGEFHFFFLELWWPWAFCTKKLFWTIHSSFFLLPSGENLPQKTLNLKCNYLQNQVKLPWWYGMDLVYFPPLIFFKSFLMWRWLVLTQLLWEVKLVKTLYEFGSLGQKWQFDDGKYCGSPVWANYYFLENSLLGNIRWWWLFCSKSEK